MIVLWAATFYLYGKKRNYFIALVPAVFMTTVSITYFLIAPECLHLPSRIAWSLGILFTVIISSYFILKMKRGK